MLGIDAGEHDKIRLMTDPPAFHSAPTAAADLRRLPESLTKLLDGWRTMALKASGRHSDACDKYERLDSFYGVGSTVLTAIVGSTIFVTLQKTASEAIRITAGPSHHEALERANEANTPHSRRSAIRKLDPMAGRFVPLALSVDRAVL